MYPAQIRPYYQPQPFGQESGLPYPQHQQQQQDLNAQGMLMMPNKGPSWMAYDEANNGGMNQQGGMTDSHNQLGLGLNRNMMGPLMGGVGGEQTQQNWDILVNGEWSWVCVQCDQGLLS